jgi:hypothetical protein
MKIDLSLFSFSLCHTSLRSSHPMRPEAREMTRRGGPPGWLEERATQPGEIFVVIRRSMPPSLTHRLLALVRSCSAASFWQIQLLLVFVQVLNVVHKTPLSRKEGMGQNSIVGPLQSLCFSPFHPSPLTPSSTIIK